MKNKEIVVSLVNENQNNNFHVISIGNHSLILIMYTSTIYMLYITQVDKALN